MMVVIVLSSMCCCDRVSLCVHFYPNREVSIEASWGAAVLFGINEGQRPECVLQQTAGECVRSLTS